MSSVPNEDDSLMRNAGDVSCDAMIELAKQEALRNRNVMAYQVVHPVCQRYQELADRGEEYVLQKPTVFGKKMCFTKTTNFQDGDWVRQFQPLKPESVAFDTWSRRKGAPM